MKNWEKNEDFLATVEKPSYTGRYAAIPHENFIDEIQEQVASRGLTITDKKYLVANNGKIMTGEYTIKGHDSDLDIGIAFKNSYNKQFSASVRSGAIVLLCSNGMYGIRGTERKRKHIGEHAWADVRANISSIVDNAEDEYNKLLKDRDELKSIKVSQSVISQLVGDMYLNESMITETQLSLLKTELKESVHFTDDSAWSFYNNVTEVLKNNHPSNYMKQHLQVYSYVSDKFSLTHSPKLYPTL